MRGPRLNPAIDVLIPVKALGRGKQRLGGVLDVEQRAALVQAMLADLLDALRASGSFRKLWIVSADAGVLSLGAGLGAYPLAEPEDAGGLNGALEWARGRVLARDEPAALLVLPSDLPGATSEDLRTFITGFADGPRRRIRLCPSPDGGTNALLLQPPAVVPFRYGRGSATAHRTEAVQCGAAVEICEPPGLRVDVDGPDDLRSGINDLTAVSGARTRALLESLYLPAAGAADATAEAPVSDGRPG